MSNGKKLVRKTDGRMIAGVALGTADYFNIDVTLIRVLFAVTTIFGGAGLIVYIVMWILVPEEGSGLTVVEHVAEESAAKPEEED
jgi:phage shock protein PspC (stress-responsive transcriptional regulator)